MVPIIIHTFVMRKEDLDFRYLPSYDEIIKFVERLDSRTFLLPTPFFLNEDEDNDNLKIEGAILKKVGTERYLIKLQGFHPFIACPYFIYLHTV